MLLGQTKEQEAGAAPAPTVFSVAELLSGACSSEVELDTVAVVLINVPGATPLFSLYTNVK
jgi:hypothetical protein